MIGQLSGILIEKQPPELVVDVNGVGYEIFAPMTTFYRLPEVGSAVKIYTHFVVREDAQLLYGFFDKAERSLFRLLIKVNGVGPKLAITILSGIESEVFIRSVQNDDAAALVKLPGVGKKTAERLIVEMRDKLDSLSEVIGSDPLSGVMSISTETTAVKEAASALESLGFKAADATKMIQQLDAVDLSSAELIRLALKSVAR